MKASELRIGNLIYNESEDDIVPIEAVDLLAMVQCEQANHPTAWLALVPLTEEWLIKLGFKQQKGYPDTWLWLGGVGMNLHRESWHYNNFTSSVKIEYIHQLQNLYFALTGKELEIKAA